MTKVAKTKTEKKLSEPTLDLSGKEGKDKEFRKEIFAVDASMRLLAQYERVYLANQRQGTASTKTRGQVTGSTRKIYRQKGTGRARHGDIKAPIFVGGGIVGGPKPRDFSLRISKKQKRKALFFSLSLKKKQNDILVLSDDFLQIQPKTKNFVAFLKSVNLLRQSLLLVLSKIEKNNLVMSVRNIANISICEAASLNAHAVLSHDKILFISQALDNLNNHFLKQNENK